MTGERYVSEGEDLETEEQRAERHLKELAELRKPRKKHSSEWLRLKEERKISKKQFKLKCGEKKPQGEQVQL